jgi:hypothetical protein
MLLDGRDEHFFIFMENVVHEMVFVLLEEGSEFAVIEMRGEDVFQIFFVNALGVDLATNNFMKIILKHLLVFFF